MKALGHGHFNQRINLHRDFTTAFTSRVYAAKYDPVDYLAIDIDKECPSRKDSDSREIVYLDIPSGCNGGKARKKISLESLLNWYLIEYEQDKVWSNMPSISEELDQYNQLN
jgi:hypothetical protein